MAAASELEKPVGSFVEAPALGASAPRIGGQLRPPDSGPECVADPPRGPLPCNPVTGRPTEQVVRGESVRDLEQDELTEQVLVRSSSTQPANADSLPIVVTEAKTCRCAVEHERAPCIDETLLIHRLAGAGRGSGQIHALPVPHSKKNPSSCKLGSSATGAPTRYTRHLVACSSKRTKGNKGKVKLLHELRDQIDSEKR